jgi:hypothetical protein
MTPHDRIARQHGSFGARALGNAAAAYPEYANHLHSSLATFREKQNISDPTLAEFSLASLRLSVGSARLGGQRDK